ncbi:cupin domain-containing protein [Cellulosilyticum lentocellum]|uniref:Cupin 2 conserved barrel domain protein n=1 Tax=Cellulosilyticum lentocellum (strain ATCC 49066 / DSM 5427 / NCIMB 11756 / RHM5) TaxID=642492 RepID=F2JIW6_CELLD|nr:cupin domain-containing protein [Cellulosilyticum lentocellum]ADZ82038.1 Cupin 2 conserved barrel domain protein [Cellulosilyticum lentocellum DSM 5427]
MENHIINDGQFIKHPTQEGVFMKHFFCSADNECLNNLEVRIIPGFMIAPHVHENSSEFFYAVEGIGEFLDGEEWRSFKKGDAFKAPKGMQHGIKNIGNETLVLFSTFSPASR